MRVSRLIAAIALAIFAMQAAAPGSALAHERRNVGKYTLVVGWLTEPSIEGQPNGIDLRIMDTATSEPVEGAEKTLKATVAFGGNAPKEFTLRARFGQKGAYTSDIIPTRSGAYLFEFAGAINGQNVSEKFESGPGRFNDVQSPANFQFPVAVQPASELQRAANDATARAAAAESAAAEARMIGFAGIGAGVLGLLAGGVALLARRSAPPETGSAPARVK